jgi:Hemocyanin, copper containing domain
MEEWCENIFKAIDQGYAERPDGTRVDLNNIHGIDLLGNMVEALPETNPNTDLYGTLGIHNYGHILLAVISEKIVQTVEIT